MARLKVATFNINGIRARLGALLAWLEREQPDVACLQELKAPDEAFPVADIERLGYGVLHHGQKSWNGVAILARGTHPVERRRGLPGDPDDSQSRYLEADVHGLRVACLYLPNGNPWPGPKFDYKLAWFAALRRHAATLLREGAPVLMCGDFNVVPTDELDIYKASSWKKDALLQPESREAWSALLEQGWTDAIRAVHGDAKIYTFWDYFRKHWERDAGLRIDHLLLGPKLAPLLRDAGVDRWVRGEAGASDHAPTWVELDTGGGARKAGASTTGSRSGGRKTGAPAGTTSGAASGGSRDTADPGRAKGAARKKTEANGAAKPAGKPAGKAAATRRSPAAGPGEQQRSARTAGAPAAKAAAAKRPAGRPAPRTAVTKKATVRKAGASSVRPPAAQASAKKASARKAPAKKAASKKGARKRASKS